MYHLYSCVCRVSPAGPGAILLQDHSSSDYVNLVWLAVCVLRTLWSSVCAPCVRRVHMRALVAGAVYAQIMHTQPDRGTHAQAERAREQPQAGS